MVKATASKSGDNMKCVSSVNSFNNNQLSPALTNQNPHSLIQSEEGLLDTLLASKIDKKNRKETIADLFENFSSLRQMICAPRHIVSAATKYGEIAHEELQKVRNFAIALAKVEFSDRPVLARYDELIVYCRTFLAGERREQFHALFFDKAKSLIASKCLARGTIDHVTVYPRDLFECAMEHAATSIILVHNHPSGQPNPSRADISMTKRLAKVGHYLGIVLSDHIIVAASGTYSFRSGGELEFGTNANLHI